MDMDARTISITPNGEIYREGERQPGSTAPKPAKSRSQISVFEFLETIGNEQDAVEFLEWKRWGDSPACPRCGTRQVSHVPREKPMRSGIVATAAVTSPSAPGR